MNRTQILVKKAVLLIFLFCICIEFSGCTAQENPLPPAHTSIAPTQNPPLSDSSIPQPSSKHLSTASNKKRESTTSEDTQPHMIGSYTTQFDESKKKRVNNIKLAANKISNHILQPGEVFSFNEAVGPTEPERGFRLATIFVKGKKQQEYGGGACQVSTTLFNAATEAGMEIIERHPHSKKVSYVPEGKDAATFYGGIDFKFKNNTSSPILIQASVEADTVSVSLSSTS